MTTLASRTSAPVEGGAITTHPLPPAGSGTTLTGNTAEWIVERPGISGSTSNLANFGEVYFDGAVASTQGNVAHHAGSGTILNMVEGSSTVSVATVESQNLIKLSYGATAS